jgi:hypothetical protein
MKTFWKGAKPNGWDLYTGKTINYRENVGKTVMIPSRDRNLKAELCTASVLHASPLPNGVFISAKIPMSLFEVTGKPVVRDDEKCGFRKLKILREIPQDEISKVLGWNYAEACNPVNPFELTAPAHVTVAHLSALKYWAHVGAQVWAQVGAQVEAQVGAQVWAQVEAQVEAQVWAQVWAQVGAQVGAQVWAQVGAQVWAQVEAQELGYISSLFPNKINENCDMLWRNGLIWTNYNGVWRLHSGPAVKIIWEGKLE